MLWATIALAWVVLVALSLAFLAVLRGSRTTVDVSPQRSEWINPGLLALSDALPPIAGFTALALLILAPSGFGTLRVDLFMHHTAMVGLFTFLTFALYLQFEGQIRIRKREDSERIWKVYRNLYVLTKLAPGPCALVLLLSGFALIGRNVPIWAAAEGNVGKGLALGRNENGWLVWLVLMLAIMAADGICFYTRKCRLMMKSAYESSNLSLGKTGFWEFGKNLHLFLHFASFPFVFLLGCFRPAWNPQGLCFRTAEGWVRVRLESWHGLSNLLASVPDWSARSAAVITAVIPVIVIAACFGLLWRATRRGAN